MPVMLGSSKQIKWAKEIREGKLEAIVEEFAMLSLFPIERLTVIQKILEAQEDAAWWIDNRSVSSYSLILWAANQVNLFPKSSAMNSTLDAIQPVPFLEPAVPNGDHSLKAWIVAIDNQQPIDLNSEIVNWQLVKNPSANPLEPTFYLHRQTQDTRSEKSHSLRQLLQQQDGGWRLNHYALKVHRFLCGLKAQVNSFLHDALNRSSCPSSFDRPSPHFSSGCLTSLRAENV